VVAKSCVECLWWRIEELRAKAGWKVGVGRICSLRESSSSMRHKVPLIAYTKTHARGNMTSNVLTSGDARGRGWYCMRPRRRPGPPCHPRYSHGVTHRISDIGRRFITCQIIVRGMMKHAELRKEMAQSCNTYQAGLDPLLRRSERDSGSFSAS
jgi:hypothetical protein